MDFFQKQPPTSPTTSSTSPDPPPVPVPDQHQPPSQHQEHDTITSLMQMADKMEALLPPECDISLHLSNRPNPPPTPPSRFTDCISSVTGATISTNPTKPEPLTFDYPRPANITELSLPLSTSSPDLSTLGLYRPYDPATEHTPHKSLSPATLPPSIPHQTTSPVAVRDLRNLTDMHTTLSLPAPSIVLPKIRKTARKPKTYSKPVASRFCHICSRMPRRGQGSATCRRMAEGFCRKIVCEQCLREQGWNYEHITANPTAWLCPHCADVCPPRSQCHIYNRINARRKRTGPSAKGGNGQPTSVAAALASSDVLMGPYGHLFNGSHQTAPHILQPPPNFRLNLPPQYSQH